jgi:hypothetical protein
MANRANLYINKNTDFQTPLSFFDDDGPIDMSAYTFFSQIRKVYSTGIVADFEFHLVNLEEGEVEMYLQSEVTKTLAEGKYQYDILIKHETGEVTKVLEGLVFITSTVTQVVFEE